MSGYTAIIFHWLDNCRAQVQHLKDFTSVSLTLTRQHVAGSVIRQQKMVALIVEN